MFSIFKKKQFEKVDELEIDKSNISHFFEHYYKNRIPLLIKGGAKKWPLFSKWSKEYISEISGLEPCTIIEDSRPASAKSQTTLRYFFKHHTDKSTLTLSDYDGKKLPEYLKDIPLPNLLFLKKDIYRYFFFFAPTNSGTLPHNHGDAFNILVKGSKEWLFYDAHKSVSPKGDRELYKTFKNYPIGSQAKDYFKKELNSLNKRIDNVTICTQEEGDIIYVPRQFSHAVLNKKDVMGIVFETKPLR